MVYAETYGEAGAPGWTTRAMVDGGMGLRDLWDSLMGAYDTVSYTTRKADGSRWTLSGRGMLKNWPSWPNDGSVIGIRSPRQR